MVGSFGDELVLTGGTALARCYLGHRFSEDLDLFHRGGHTQELGRELAESLRAANFKVSVETDSAGFLRCMVGDTVTRIQVGVAADLPRVESPAQSALGVYVRSLREIAANKIVAFEDRAELKDAVDLYYLTERVGWEQMVADADAKRVPLDYEALQMLLSQPLSGKVLLTDPLTDIQLREFLDRFRIDLQRTVEKKTAFATTNLQAIVAKLLWDAPRRERVIDAATTPVLRRRASRLPLPERTALVRALSNTARP